LISAVWVIHAVAAEHLAATMDRAEAAAALPAGKDTSDSAPELPVMPSQETATACPTPQDNAGATPAKRLRLTKKALPNCAWVDALPVPVRAERDALMGRLAAHLEERCTYRAFAENVKKRLKTEGVSVAEQTKQVNKEWSALTLKQKKKSERQCCIQSQN